MSKYPRYKSNTRSMRGCNGISGDKVTMLEVTGTQTIRGTSANELEMEKDAIQFVMPCLPVVPRRQSCHRCGNIRKYVNVCYDKNCPFVYCNGCVNKLISAYGDGCFREGCPKCLLYCCCAGKTMSCNRVLHCYKKCPVSRSQPPTRKHNPRKLQDIKNGPSLQELIDPQNYLNGDAGKCKRRKANKQKPDYPIFHEEPLYLTDRFKELTMCSPFFFQPSLSAAFIQLPSLESLFQYHPILQNSDDDELTREAQNKIIKKENHNQYNLETQNNESFKEEVVDILSKINEASPCELRKVSSQEFLLSTNELQNDCDLSMDLQTPMKGRFRNISPNSDDYIFVNGIEITSPVNCDADQVASTLQFISGGTFTNESPTEFLSMLLNPME